MQNQVPKVKSSFPFRPRLFEQQCGLYLQPLRQKEYFKHYTRSVQQLVWQRSVASANELLLCFLSCHVILSSHVIIAKREIVTQVMRSNLSNNDGRNFSRKKIVMYSKFHEIIS